MAELVITDGGDTTSDTAVVAGEAASAAAEAVAEVAVALIETQPTDYVSRSEFEGLRSDVASLTAAVESSLTLSIAAAESAAESADAAEEVAEAVSETPDVAPVDVEESVPAPEPRQSEPAPSEDRSGGSKKKSGYGNNSWFAR